MFMDKDGNLWFGTNGGITYHQGDTWKTFTQPDGLNSINSPIFQDAQGNIWWATNTGISRFDGKTVRKFDASDGIDMDYFVSVSSIVQDNQGNIWFGTQYSKQIATFPHGTTPDPNINKQPEGGIYATMVNHGKNSRPKTDYPVQTFKK
jgi:ligand-binding sensor domain-containing protein